MKIEGGAPGLTGHMSKDSSLNSSGINMAAQSVILDEPDVPEDFEPTQQEILEYAAWLGMDPEREAHLLWIAKEGIKAPLPPDWKPCRSSSGDVYYFDFRTGESRWEHPADDHYKALYQQKRLQAGPGGATADTSTDSPKRLSFKPSPTSSPVRPIASSPGKGSPKPPVPSVSLGSFPLPIGTVNPRVSQPAGDRGGGGGSNNQAVVVQDGVDAQALRIQAEVDDIVANRIKDEVRGREANIREGVEQGVRACVATGVAGSDDLVRERVEAVVAQRVEEALRQQEARISDEAERGVLEAVAERVAEGVRAREAEVEGQIAMQMGAGGSVQALVEQKVEELVEEGLAMQENRIKEEVEGRVREAVVRRTKAGVDSGVAEQAGRVKEMVEEKVREKAFERVEKELGKGAVQKRVEEELGRRVEEGVDAATKRGEITGRVEEALRKRVNEKLTAAGVEKGIDDKVKQRLAIEEEKVRQRVEAEVAKLVKVGVSAQSQRVRDEVDANVCRMILEGAEVEFTQAIKEGKISAGGTAKGMLEAEREAHKQERERIERERADLKEALDALARESKEALDAHTKESKEALDAQTREAEAQKRDLEAQRIRIASLEKSLEKALLNNVSTSPLSLSASADGASKAPKQPPLGQVGIVGAVVVPAAVAAAAYVAIARR